MLFSERKAIEDRFEGWCLKNRVKNCASNFLAWLQSDDPEGIASLELVKKMHSNEQVRDAVRRLNEKAT